MKKKTSGTVFIKEVLKTGHCTGNTNNLKKNKKAFTSLDLKKFSPSKRILFLETYYHIPTSYYGYSWEDNVLKWMNSLESYKVQLIVPSVEDMNSMLFSLMINEDYHERAASFMKRYKKILSKVNGQVIKYKKEAKKIMAAHDELKNTLKASKNWAWDKNKEK